MKDRVSLLGSLEEADQIRELFLEVYGEGYPVDTYYRPEKLWAEHQSGSTVCGVGRDETGAVVAHLAAYRSAPSHDLYELGAGLVSKRSRGGGLAKELARFLIAHLRESGSARLLFGESVCNHIYSQYTLNGLGFRDTALEVDLMPAEAYLQEASAEGRVSTVLSFLPLDEKQETIYLPGVYDRQLRELYGGLELPRTFQPAQGGQPEADTCEFDQLRIDSAGLTRLQFRRLGRDLPSLLDHSSAVFQLMLPLTEPQLEAAVTQARAEGFFFGGLLPRWTGTDTLLLQRLQEPPNWDGIKLYSKTIKAALTDIRSDYETVSRSAT